MAEHFDLVEQCAFILSGFAVSPSPMAMPDVYSKRGTTEDELWHRWNEQGQQYLALDDLIARLRELAARAGEVWTPPPSPPNQRSAEPVERDEYIQRMERAVRLAYLAFYYAESRAGRRLEDREAHELLKEEGIPEGAGERGELAEYQLPSFDTWSRYLREARSQLGEQKHTRRSGRQHGKSIMSGDQIEQQRAIEE
jgi:hypothetical protein